MSLEDDLLKAINSWPNKPWLVLPGPTDLAPSLAAHLAKELTPDTCPSCGHPSHLGRRLCGNLKTEDIEDTVSLFGKATGETHTIVTGVCRCDES